MAPARIASELNIFSLLIPAGQTIRAVAFRTPEAFRRTPRYHEDLRSKRPHYEDAARVETPSRRARWCRVAVIPQP